jgi:chromosome segregation ATPase
MAEVSSSQEDIRKVEEELLAKRKAQEESERARAQKLVEDAEKRGKEAALRELEEEQRRKKLEDELAQVKARAAALEEETKRAMEEASKRWSEELEKLKSERKGISRNDSPFSAPPTPDATADTLARLKSDPAYAEAVNRESMNAFARAHGFQFK